MLMIGLYISLALLGLSAIDPVGIGIMQVLLTQKKPYQRSFVFLLGSFVSLMILGILFARGLGKIVLNFEHNNHWFIPTVEVVAAILLLVVALVSYLELRKGNTKTEPSKRIKNWLKLNDWILFFAGAVLVAAQSVFDVVFVVAMIKSGQYGLSNIVLFGAIAVYAIAALIFQIAIVMIYRFTPVNKQTETLASIKKKVPKYSYQGLIFVSIVLSAVLFTLAAKA
jgi:hypothetical protein